MRKTPLTAAELKAELDRDPKYQEVMRRQERDLERRRREFQEAEQPVLAELRNVGVHVNSIWELTTAGTPDPEVFDLLLEQLRMAYPSKVRE